MSMDVIKLIPVNPLYIPENHRQEEAKELLKTFVSQSSEVETIVFDEVTFIDQGTNFEKVLCNNCGTEITDWWQDVFDNAYENGFKNLEIELRCCGQKSSLNDLTYEWPAGFACFVLQATDPDIYDLNDNDIKKLENTLDCQLKKVRAHY